MSDYLLLMLRISRAVARMMVRDEEPVVGRPVVSGPVVCSGAARAVGSSLRQVGVLMHAREAQTWVRGGSPGRRASSPISED